MATAANTVNKIQKFSYTSANNTTVYNSDLKVQGNIAITGAYNSDLTVVGNLTVLGSQTYAQTQTLLVKDNIITLNAAIDQSGTPLFNAGIEVDRGNQPNVAFIWNESTQAWQFTNNGTTYESLGGGSAGVYANGAFIQANAAFNAANNSSDPWVRNQANASFIQANAAFNAANNASDSWVRNQANSAFVQANAAYAFANSRSAWGTRQAFKATAGQTVFSPGSGYLPGSVDVYYNGLKLYDGEDFTATDGVNVILANPATVNSTIDIVGFGANSVAANVYVLNSMTSIVQRQTFFANSGQTTFTVTGGYRIGYLDVFYNGLKINIPEDVTANNGTTINFIGLTPSTNDIIEVVGLTPNIALANAIPITGGTISGSLSLAGNVTPVTDNTYYLGSATNRWHSLFVGPGSIDIGGLKLSNVGGTLSVASPGAPATPIAGEDTWVRTQANSSFVKANLSLQQATSAYDSQNTTGTYANAAFTQANAAFASANNVAPQIQPAFNTANSAALYANGAFIKANSAAQYDANTLTTGYFSLPSGNTAQRPASPSPGALRFNTANAALELYYNGWNTVYYAGSILAEGGTIVTSGNYKLHIFTGSGSFTISAVPATGALVDWLVVAGGGGGGGRHGGGGGGGGVVYVSQSTVLTTGTYTVTVGAGGTGALTDVVGGNGANSSFGSYGTGVGGGGGGTYVGNDTRIAGQPGGSGGGAGHGPTSGGSKTQGTSPYGTTYGNAGGNNPGNAQEGGGGGGAGGVGFDGQSQTIGGAGGPGISLPIYNDYYWAGGGGGAGWEQPAGVGGIGGGGGGGAGGVPSATYAGGGSAINAGSSGIGGTGGAVSGGAGGTNSGGGGGGSGQYGYASYDGHGGNGGSGIVIIRYRYQ